MKKYGDIIPINSITQIIDKWTVIYAKKRDMNIKYNDKNDNDSNNSDDNHILITAMLIIKMIITIIINI